MQLLSDTIKPASSKPKSRPVATCARELLDAAPSLLWYIRLNMRQHRKGLSVPQFRALVKIRNEPAASLSIVAEHLGSSLPTASRTVSTLVNKGLLSRSGSLRDRRQCALTLTPRGRRIVEDALAVTQAQMESDLAGLTAQQRATVRDAMVLLRNVFEEVRAHQSLPVVASKAASDMPRPPRRRAARPSAKNVLASVKE